MERVTRKDLDNVCRRINRLVNGEDDELGSKLWTYRDDGSLIATVGMFYIDGAYGGFSLYRMSNEGGGVSDIFNVGHAPKRELYGLMQAYIRGICDAREADRLVSA